MKIKSLSKETLEDAINLVNEVFPLPTQGEELADPCFRSSLDKDKYQDFLNKTNVDNAEYWTAVNDEDKVIGTTGLYTYKTKEEENTSECNDKEKRKIIWMGWMCVDKNQRGKGTGTALVQFTIDESIRRGFTDLMLYNTNSPIVEAANRIYERMGFTKKQEGNFSVKGEDGKEVLYDLYFWRLDLTKSEVKK